MHHARRASVFPQRRRRLRRLFLGASLLMSAVVLLGLNWTAALELRPRVLNQDWRQDLQGGLQRLTNMLLGPPRVGLQVGHEHAEEHPDELATLRASTGGYARGVYEVDLNREVAEALKEKLERHGVRVDILDATPPPGYHADLLVSIHADSNHDASRRGYKSAHFDPARNPLEPLLKSYLDEAYLSHSELPDDSENISGSMNYYYAFNFRRFRHSVHPGTPAVIVELGYISNPRDWRYLSDPARPAEALAQGIAAFLRAQGRLPQQEHLAGR